MIRETIHSPETDQELSFFPRLTLIAAQNQPMFDTLAASLKTVKVDSDKLFESLRPKEPNLENLSKQSSVAGVRCRATIDGSRYGRGPDEFQTTAAFQVVEQLHPLRGIPKTQKLEGLQPFALDSISDKGAPHGFRKVRELTFKMELVIENHDTQ